MSPKLSGMRSLERSRRKKLGLSLLAAAGLSTYRAHELLAALAVATLILVPGSLLVAGWMLLWRESGGKENTSVAVPAAAKEARASGD